MDTFMSRISMLASLGYITITKATGGRNKRDPINNDKQTSRKKLRSDMNDLMKEKNIHF